ncbi:MAG TPA: response regulator [Polyangiaceae bacterium]|nr:response regulator [Polyangiaceae bacterium]
MANQALKRILVAEDDPAIGNMLLKVLSQSYDVVLTTDGASAVKAASQPPPPDLLLLDVMMPSMDGHAVAAAVRLVPGLKSVPIIFLTAKTGPAEVIKGIQSGARHYITKPFKIDDLVMRVKRALGG